MTKRDQQHILSDEKIHYAPFRLLQLIFYQLNIHKSINYAREHKNQNLKILKLNY